MSSKAYSVVDDKTGLGFAYRFRWRFMYIATSITGPAARQASLDPRTQLQQERARRLLAGYQEAGQEPPAEVLRLAGRS